MFIKNGVILGYSIDHIKLLASKVNLKVDIIQGYTWNEYLQLLKDENLDVMLNIIQTTKREEFFLFTKSYYSHINSMFTRKRESYNSLDDFKGKTLSIVRGFSEVALLNEFYPTIQLLFVNDELEALKMVSFGKADGTINNLSVGSAILENYALSDITPSFEIKDKRFNVEIHLATNKNNKHLRNILDKAQTMVTKEEMQDLSNKWIIEKQIYDQYKLNYELFKYILIAIVMIIVMGFYRYYIVKKINKKLIEQSKELRDAKEKLQQLAFTDPMTSLYNRRYFIESSSSILKLAIRNKTESFVIIIDIDDFKQVNDSYGHKVGDDVIIHCAKKFKELTRNSDIICRWGGEEFTILFPEISLHGALEISEKIRSSIKKSIITLKNKEEVKFTISIGLTKVINKDGTNIDISISRADEALYQAKKNGKNRVCKYNIE